MDVLIRHADPDRDAAACAEIYGPFVRDTVISLEEVAPGEREFAERIRRVSLTHPWLVAEVGGPVVGFAYASAHRERASYRWAADVAVYLDPEYHARGIGRALYGALLPLLERQGIRVACAGITLPNDASVALHERFGFEQVGVYRRIGWKAGEWRNVGWWQLELVAPGEHAPPDPGPPARLTGA
ncbi:MAG TPA: GNAT family N-acetyltransferase [Solirubrobacteraceae bacterium]|nr:GNAT family N-acetyltransferase [Solirubrobacteraceae bacterium]